MRKRRYNYEVIFNFKNKNIIQDIKITQLDNVSL